MLLDAVKNYLWISDTSQDQELQLFINDAKNYVITIIWDIDKKDLVLFDFSWNKQIFLNSWINQIVKNISYNSGSITSPDYIEYTKYRVINDIILLNNAFKELKIELSTGYEESDIPADIVNAICLFVKDAKDLKNVNTGIKQETVDGDTIIFNNNSSITADTQWQIYNLLKKYLKYDFCA